MALSYMVGQQFCVLNQARASPRRTRRKYDFRLLSPNTVTNGNTTFHHRRYHAGSGTPPVLAEIDCLIAWGKQCVLSPRPHHCTSTLSKAEYERSQEAEEIEREQTSTHRSLGKQKVSSGTLETLDEKVRVHSTVGRRRVSLTSIRRPSTAPASTQTGQRDTQQRPETPSCRVVWRTREGEHGQPESPDSTARGTPALHLYLPSYQLPSIAHENIQDADLRSEVNTRLYTQTDKQQGDVMHMSQHDFTESKAQQETLIPRWNESKEGTEDENSVRNGECKNEKNKKSETTEEKVGGSNNPLQDDTGGKTKHNEKNGLVEDNRQHEVTQGDISKRDENKQNKIGENLRHNDYTETVKQLDIKEQYQERSTAEENRLQGCQENNCSYEVADKIKGSIKMEPDFENLQSSYDHKDQIKTQNHLENDLPIITMHQKENQQVLEKREQAPPPKLKSGCDQITTSCLLGQTSETNSLRRITHPTSVILFPAPCTATYSSPLPHTLPSFYGSPFGYRLRTLHTPQSHHAKTWTTSISLDKRVIKTKKELPQSKETKGNHHVSKLESRGTTGPHPKIMSSEWGAPPCKTKTTKTFVWGPWGPQETKHVCELHTHANRCDGGPEICGDLKNCLKDVILPTEHK